MPDPVLRLDTGAFRQTLVFAFASGVPSSAFDQAIEESKLPSSTWVADSFVRELFLSDFVHQCMRVKIDGTPCSINETWLKRVLSQPPSDIDTVHYRRRILRELAASDPLRKDFERLYVATQRLRSQLEAVPGLRRIDSNRRRLDILACLKKCFEVAAEGFELAESGLRRIREFGASVLISPAYKSLAAVLEYDENLATVDVRMRLGSDGRIRGTFLLESRENKGNAFYLSPLGRFLSKVMLVLRGYHFGDEEVLSRLIDGVFDGFEDEVVRLFQLMADMEFYLAGLAFQDFSRTHGLRVCFPELVVEKEANTQDGDSNVAPLPERFWHGLFNPLLLGHVPKVVPCDLSTSRPDLSLILTGPNSGGKTRLLQSVALAQMLAQAGQFIPASAACLYWTEGLFVSLIEQATADQSEGRLGMELIRIRSLFERLRMGSMVIVDELCSGTNPSEGEEMFELVVTLLAELKPQAFITTHFLALAARLEKKPPTDTLSFLQVELDQHQLPTYQFVHGVAPTSLAHRTAARLGVTREELWALVQQSKRLNGRA